MKALIRNKGETVTENSGIVGIDWKTGAPLTNPSWCGGPYTLVNDYTPEDPIGESASAAVPEASQDPGTDVQDTIVIDGVTYIRTS